MLTPNIWEDGPTHVRFAHCRNKQGPGDETLQESFAVWKASQEKKRLKKMKAKERRPMAKSSQKLGSKPAPNREQAATTAEKKNRTEEKQVVEQAGLPRRSIFFEEAVQAACRCRGGVCVHDEDMDALQHVH